MEKIISKEDGMEVAIEILKMRFIKSDDRPLEFSEKLIKLARHILTIYPFSKERGRHDNPDYDLAQVARDLLKR